MKKYVYNLVRESVNRQLMERRLVENALANFKSMLAEDESTEIHRAITALNDPRFDRSEIMRNVKPGMNDDTLRSLASKMARGERPISAEDAVDINQEVKKKVSSGI